MAGRLPLATLQHEVLLADDLPGVWIRATRFEREGQRRILVVDARREDFCRLGFGGRPTRTKPVGPARGAD